MITVDLHGEIEMQQYVNAAKNDWLKIFGALDAKFYDERSVYKVETDNAIMAGRIVFQNTEPANDASGNSTISASHPKDTEAMDHNIWKFMRIIRFKERMYSIVGTVIESAGMDEIATNDLLSIMKTFVILEQ
jgi:hypothetical protein